MIKLISIEAFLKHLEKAGFYYVKENTEESTKKVWRAFGQDSRGVFLEFQYSPEVGYILDRAVGSKYWDIT